MALPIRSESIRMRAKRNFCMMRKNKKQLLCVLCALSLFLFSSCKILSPFPKHGRARQLNTLLRRRTESRIPSVIIPGILNTLISLSKSVPEILLINVLFLSLFLSLRTLYNLRMMKQMKQSFLRSMRK